MSISILVSLLILFSFSRFIILSWIDQNFCVNLNAEEIPLSDHCISFSGGLSDKMKNLTASAPYKLIIFSGSTVFFLDLDIDSDGPTIMVSSGLPLLK